MKGRDSRRQTLIMAASGIVGGAVAGALVGIGFATPYLMTKGAETAQNLSNEARRRHAAGIPAAKAKKAELDALNKEKKQLEKDKKALEKKKLNARKNQAKKIYNERVANGYEASVPVLEREAEIAFANAEAYDGGKKKARKQKKSKKNTPVVIEKQDRLRIAMDPKRKYNPYEDVEVGEEDYSSSADMFKGISFNS
ncbi:MAG: hypothetical protein J5782_00515 [Clostridia bacterium]|nr:hypothetical protein [Clostridia bacterium]